MHQSLLTLIHPIRQHRATAAADAVAQELQRAAAARRIHEPVRPQTGSGRE